jgi:hypothetical protein
MAHSRSEGCTRFLGNTDRIMHNDSRIMGKVCCIECQDVLTPCTSIAATSRASWSFSRKPLERQQVDAIPHKRRRNPAVGRPHFPRRLEASQPRWVLNRVRCCRAASSRQPKSQTGSAMSRRCDFRRALIARSPRERAGSVGEHDEFGARAHSCRPERPLAIPVVFTSVDALAAYRLV